ncbi:caspase family protein [Anatilimnocola aggregata]|uniref:caspase family protein n=1 Tax=Anatilimnocola aggregata TaxID=2528021 RepID=UPI00192E5DFD|nr:caspase family protein [Anatilimnocola aggregata]
MVSIALRRIVLLICSCLLTSPLANGLLCAQPATPFAAEPDEAGINIVSGIPKAGGYRRSWAVVIGINYEKTVLPEAARSLVPPLRNAENDAQVLQEVLIKLYGYEPQCVLLLQGPTATKQEIERALNDLKDEAKIKPDDSLLVFFSGHGTRIENESDERGAIYAANVEFTERGKLKGGCLRMHKDLLPLLDACPAKHKMLVLDCCHSGEIFSLRARSRSEADDRRSNALFEAKGSIQAMASCRDRQRASDGIGANSPFTAALLQGLRRIPAREDSDHARIGVNQLFTYMLPELKNLPNGQSPDCRLLGEVDGEFSFFPASTPEAVAEFALHRTSKEEFRLLQAMVPGDHGNWWFDEMPWFVPSLRLMILEKTIPERAALQSSAIRSDELHKLAEDLHRELQEQLNKLRDASGDPIKRKLLQLRLNHFKSLLTKTTKDSRSTVNQIVDDFDCLTPEEQQALTASDLHLLAVAQHFLHQETNETEEVEAAYLAALARFDVNIGNELALKSLCHADYGQFLSMVKRDYVGAATQFHEALGLFGSDLTPNAKTVDMLGQPITPPDSEGVAPQASIKSELPGATRRIIAGSAPPAFRVFVLCSEAEAWQRQNRWGRANDLLNTALHVARGFDAEHELMVFVLNKVAWANMEQWRISEAQLYFRQANEILARLSRTTNDVDRSEPVRPLLLPESSTVDTRWADLKVMLGYDYHSLVRYLHHLHGLAMAKRFRGHEHEAVEDFRLIVQMTAEAMSQLKQGAANAQVTGDAEKRLLERLVNSQERLADCNLFGDAAERDLREAADDYRRALQACASMPAGTTRNQRRMALLYRLAVTLSLPSKVQDVDLATKYCQEAHGLHDALHLRSVEVNGTLAKLAEAIVDVFAEKEARLPLPPVAASADISGTKGPRELDSLSRLRKTIHDLCDELNGNLHRDQLEMLLLSSKVLADEVPDSDRFHLAEDAEQLLYLCRLVLPKSSLAGDFLQRPEDAGAYLRSYFDSVLRTKLRMKPKHVKDLLEVQWEATRGEFYTKPQQNAPVLAVYLLDDQCYLLLDVPGGVSRHFCLEGKYYVAAVKRGCYNADYRLPLPDELQHELAQLRKREAASDLTEGPLEDVETAKLTSSRLQLRWIDPVRGLSISRTLPAGAVALKPVNAGFPFDLPKGIETSEVLSKGQRTFD